jgi:hypothetical protein
VVADEDIALSLRWGYGALAGIAAVAFLSIGVLFALTVPYHDWDAFAYGEWSRRIATRHAWDPAPLGPYAASRPAFFVLQGLLWSVTGVSFVVGRLLSLLFAVCAVVGTACLVERKQGRALALVAFLSIPAFAAEAIAGKTDVPAAAGVAVAAAVALRAPFPRQRELVGTLALLAVLAKPSSVVPALAGIALALALVERPSTRSRLIQSTAFAVVVGSSVALFYEWAMAVHLHMNLFEFLRAGTTGYYAQLADSVRWHTLLRLDFLGADLRFPLAFALAYSAVRWFIHRHRSAAWIAFGIGGSYAAIGPFAAGDKHGPFVSAEATFSFIGFALVLLALPFAPNDLEPSRRRVAQLLVIALPPTAVWAAYGVYETRLEAPAWPALAAMIGLCLFSAIRTIHRQMGAASLAAIPVLAVVLWGSLVSFDGFHEPLWVEYRALGFSGIWNRDETTNIVLPAVSETVEALRAQIGTDGRVVASDPHFFWWFPHTTIAYPITCAALKNADGFVLSTSDESQLVMRNAGGSPDPAVWAACQKPRLRELTDGSNGMAAFVVEH